MRRPTPVVGALAALIACSGVASTGYAAGPLKLSLPATNTYLLPTPPLSGTDLQAPTVFRHGVRSSQRVLVGLGESGDVRRVSVADHLSVGRGDFFFGIPLPDIRATGGGGPTAQILIKKDLVQWQGFSPGHEDLRFNARLRPRSARAGLPVRIRVMERVDGHTVRAGQHRSGSLHLRVEIEDVARATFPISQADADPTELGATLDAVRHLHSDAATFVPPAANVTGSVTNSKQSIGLPVALSGTLTIPVEKASGIAVEGAGAVSQTDGRIRIHFARTLGDRSPLRYVLMVSGTVKRVSGTNVSMLARPAAPVRLLTPPQGAGSWSSAAREGLIGGRQLLGIAETSLLQLALARQYNQFLENPDTLGANRTVYMYATTSERTSSHAPVPPRPSQSWPEPIQAILATLAALLLLGAGVVAWAKL